MKALHERNQTNIDVSSLLNRFNNYRDVIKIKTRHLVVCYPKSPMQCPLPRFPFGGLPSTLTPPR